MASNDFVCPADLQHRLTQEERSQTTFVWEKDSISPFNDVVIGWNAFRPSYGQYHLSISLKLKEWTPWFSYARWGTTTQNSFEHQWGPLHIFQDTVNITAGSAATGWRVKVEAMGQTHLQGFHRCYASIPSYQNMSKSFFSYVCLEVPGISQIKLQDPRHMRICSPTSMTAVIRFFNQRASMTPLEFADKVWDSHFDIYGHWVFAAAQAYAELGDTWETSVRYLKGFDDIYSFLQAGYPVVVSVRGPLPGSFHPYAQGHLLVVRGYDPEQNRVLCMDPAYPEDAQTLTSYALDDFLISWQRRKNIAYLFQRRLHGVDVSVG